MAEHEIERIFGRPPRPRAVVDRVGLFAGLLSVPPGAGDLDLPRLLPRLAALPNLQAVLVEQDPATESPIEDMANSRRFLQEQFGL